ncbi:hypothetical protein J2W71_004514 [Pseudomonas sp. 3400]|jgi:hypothetical protein|nr:hypothetical protein [Pseudomonas sp. 3400]MDR7014281.1 hypothetical protein [Pseudomonas alcaliphila]
MLVHPFRSNFVTSSKGEASYFQFHDFFLKIFSD